MLYNSWRIFENLGNTPCSLHGSSAQVAPLKLYKWIIHLTVHAVSKHWAVCSKQNAIAWCVIQETKQAIVSLIKIYIMTPFLPLTWIFPFEYWSLVCVCARLRVCVCCYNLTNYEKQNFMYVLFCKTMLFVSVFLRAGMWKLIPCYSWAVWCQSLNGGHSLALEFVQNKSPLDPWEEKKKILPAVYIFIFLLGLVDLTNTYSIKIWQVNYK